MDNDMKNKDLDFELLKNTRSVRMHLAEQSHYYFFHLYMSEYVKHPTADFHRELYAITEDESIKHAVIVAFRGSGKSTIITQSYPMWAILGVQKKKFVVILSQTQNQARNHLLNIKREFENNELLRKDFGPLEEEADEWGSTALILPKYKARIVTASTEQAIRGVRHGAYRPDLIIADDVEDMSSIKTIEGRNKTYEWFTGDILPLGDEDTKIITIGNLLHEDSLLMRLKDNIENESMVGVFKRYPLVNVDGESLWHGKYPDTKSILAKEKEIGNVRAWQREYLLLIVPDEGQIIDQKWIKYYEELPEKDEENEYINTYIGVDLAISKSNSADYTAITVVHVYGHAIKDRRYFIDRHFINERLGFFETCERINSYSRLFEIEYRPLVLVENVAYQQSAVEVLVSQGLDVEGLGVKGDKHSRLVTASMLFEQGKVLFPTNKSMNKMISQLVHFGVEKHDDLVDALTLVLNYVHTKVDEGHFDFAIF